MKGPNLQSKIGYCCLIVFGFLLLVFSLVSIKPAVAASASLYLSPPSRTYTVGSTFSVRVKVNSGGEAINASEGTLVFNPDEIWVVSLSKSGSILTLWTTEPTFSNSAGDIVFGGGTPIGFTGSSGTLITVTLRARSVSSSSVNFSSGSVLAADGKGTNILTSMNGGVYALKAEIIEGVSPEEYVSPPTPKAPTAPIISSSTHPDPDKWYSNNNPKFSWKLPSDVTGVSLLLHESPTGDPGSTSDGLMESKKFEDAENGTWYFHIRFKNEYGWGKITHRKVLIDTRSPEPFELGVDNGGDSTNPRPILHFKTTDSLSGIDYYEVIIGEGSSIPITSAYLKENPYKMMLQAPGKHTVMVKAIDGAGNSTIATSDVVVEPIEPPIVTGFPEVVEVGGTLIIRGTSRYADATVRVFVKREGEEVRAGDVRTDNEGNWFFVYGKSLTKGTYQVWAEITDSRGAKSHPTDKITIAATLPIILRLGELAIDYLTLMITLLSLIIVLTLIILYGRRRISLLRKRVRIETKEAAQVVYSAFKTLKKEVQEQIGNLNKKPKLTKKEKEVRDRLQKALDTSEEFIKKEIKDIKKELER